MDVVEVAEVVDVGGRGEVSAVGVGSGVDGKVFVVVGTGEGKVLWGWLGDAGRRTLQVAEKVSVGRGGEVRALEVFELGEERKVVVVLCDGDVSLLEIPGLEPVEELDGWLRELMHGAQALAVQLGDGVAHIAAVVRSKLILAEIDTVSGTKRLIGDVQMSCEAVAVTFGGEGARSLMASIKSQHVLVRAGKTAGRAGLAIAADICADESSNGDAAEEKTHGSDADKQGVGGAIFSALTMGLANGGLNGNNYLRRKTLAISLPGEHWLLSVDDRTVGVYSSYGAFIGSGREQGFGEPGSAFVCMDGTVILVKDLNGASDTLDVLAAGSGVAVLLQSLNLEALRRRVRVPAGHWVLQGVQEIAGTVVGVVRFVKSTRFALIRTTTKREAAVDKLISGGELKLALALTTTSKKDELISRELREKLARVALLKGQHGEALEYLRQAGYSPQEILSIRTEVVPDSWRLQENVTAWADLLFRSRQRGAAAKEPNETTDAAVLEALCLADHDEQRIISLLSSRHAISTLRGEELIAFSEKRGHLTAEAREHALIELFRTTGEHDRALELIENSTFIPNRWDRAAAYLCEVDDVDVVLNHLALLLKTGKTAADTQTAVDVLIEAPIPTSTKHHFAETQRSDFLVLYAESALSSDVQDRATIQNALVKVLCDELDKLNQLNQLNQRRPGNLPSAAGSTSFPKESKEIEEQDGSVDPPPPLSPTLSLSAATLREKICEALEPTVEDPNFVLAHLPDELSEQRAKMLGALGRHDEAIRILAMEAEDATAAERYCQSFHEDRPGAAMTSLVRAYLQSSAERPDSVRRAAALLATRGAELVNIADTLNGVDESTPLSTLHEYIRTAISVATAKARATKAHHALLKSESFRRRDYLLRLRGKSISVGPESTCTVCRRRIGDSVFAAYNNGSLVHYACFRSTRSNSDN